MRKLTSAWTDQHVPVALALVASLVAGAVTALLDQPARLLGIAALAVTALLALFLDSFGGIVLGVVVAAAVVFALHLAAQWTTEAFLPSLVLVLGLVAVGWLAGMVSAGIHQRRASATETGDGLAPAYGSLGLLPEGVALMRLEEEVARAQRYDRPLTIAVVRVVLTDPALDPVAGQAAQRAVARLVESQLRDTDVPFVLAPDELGALLPETEVTAAWDVLGPVVDAATRAAFTVREQDERRNLVECAELHVGLAALDAGVSAPGDLLSEARRSARTDDVPSGAAQPAEDTR